MRWVGESFTIHIVNPLKDGGSPLLAFLLDVCCCVFGNRGSLLVTVTWCLWLHAPCSVLRALLLLLALFDRMADILYAQAARNKSVLRYRGSLFQRQKNSFADLDVNPSLASWLRRLGARWYHSFHHCAPPAQASDS